MMILKNLQVHHIQFIFRIMAPSPLSYPPKQKNIYGIDMSGNLVHTFPRHSLGDDHPWDKSYWWTQHWFEFHLKMMVWWYSWGLMRRLEGLVKYDERFKIDKRLHQAAPRRFRKWLGHWMVLQLYQNRYSSIINKRCVVVGSHKLDPVGQLCFAPKHQMLWSSSVKSSQVLDIDWKGSVCPGISRSVIHSCLLTWLIMYHST